MAIDTEDKRMSMLSWHSGRKAPQPDGAIDQNDRQTLMGRYGGILWASATVVETPAETGGGIGSIPVKSEEEVEKLLREIQEEQRKEFKETQKETKRESKKEPFKFEPTPELKELKKVRETLKLPKQILELREKKLLIKAIEKDLRIEAEKELKLENEKAIIMILSMI